MKPKSGLYAEYNVNSNAKDAKCKLGNRVRISKYKNLFAKGYTPNWSEEAFAISKIKNTVPGTYGINELSWNFLLKRIAEDKLKKSS